MWAANRVGQGSRVGLHALQPRPPNKSNAGLLVALCKTSSIHSSRMRHKLCIMLIRHSFLVVLQSHYVRSVILASFVFVNLSFSFGLCSSQVLFIWLIVAAFLVFHLCRLEHKWNILHCHLMTQAKQDKFYKNRPSVKKCDC